MASNWLSTTQPNEPSNKDDLNNFELDFSLDTDLLEYCLSHNWLNPIHVDDSTALNILPYPSFRYTLDGASVYLSVRLDLQ